MLQQPPLKNKKISLVTGASGGIGSAIVRALCRDGFSVAIHYNTDYDSAAALKNEVTAFGAEAEIFQADISNPESVRLLFREIENKLGNVTALVNNAGKASQKLITDLTDSEWRSIIDTDLSGAFYCCREALSAMLHCHSGKIINIASMWGETGASMEVAYSAAKAGIIGLTKALAKEVGPSGITVNAVSPGVIKTDMLSSFSASELEELANEAPLERLGEPADVAGAVSFLLSEKADFITGQIISVNGGFVI